MTIWSAEIKELETLFTSIKGRFPDLEKELERLVKADDENIVLLYSRRCLEVIITDLCESELKRPRKTEPLKGIIDKLHHEEKIPFHISASMQNLNTLSTFGAHPKEFDPRQVKPVLNNLTTILEWYLKYKEAQAISKPKEEVKDETKAPDDSTGQFQKPKKKVILLLSGLLLVCIVVVALFVFNIIGGEKQFKELEKSIAVLPFDNMSVGEEYIHMGDAITDEVIMELQKIKAFDRVLSRTSTMQYKEDRPTIPEIAEKLGVTYIIEGSIQRHKEQVSIRVQVIRAKHEDHIWGDEFNGEWDDIFSLQDEIAFKVARELKAVLSYEEMKLIENKPTENPEAYNSYLLGRYFWNKRTEEDMKKSIKYFEQAIENDPEYALAYTGIADAYIVLADWGYFNPKEAYPKAKQYVEKALEINNKLAECHTSLACLTYIYDWNWQDAEKVFKRAIELYQNDAMLHQEYADFLSKLERVDEASDQIELALELDPTLIISNLVKGWIFYRTKQYDEAISHFQKIQDIDKNFAEVHYFISLCYLKKGIYEEAVEEYKKMMSMDTESSKYLTTVSNVYEESGINGFYYWLVDEGINLKRQTYNRPYYIARFYTALGDHEKAFEWLDSACDMHSYWLGTLKVDPFFDSLHSDPRYINLLKKIGLDD